MQYEVIVSGSGFAALLMTVALKKAGINVFLVRDDCNYENDGRVFAISACSKAYLEELNIWPKLEHEACQIDDIVVMDREIKLHYDSNMVGEPMGYTIRASRLFSVMMQFIEGTLSGCNKRIKQIKYTHSLASITLDDDSIVTSPLLICAEGKNSSTRKLLNVPVLNLKYDQAILTFVIKHELNHESLALERFLDHGPFATLPMEGGYHSSVIFTEKPSVIEYFSERKSEMETEVKNRMLAYLGDISIEGDIFKYDLSLTLPRRLHKNRVVFISDAAHAIHPVAGQGFNLGIRDVENLAGLIGECRQYGLDIGSEFVLKKYVCNRLPDTLIMAGATDIIARVFSAEHKIIKSIRGCCMSFAETNMTIKKMMVRYAMGYIHDCL